MSDLSNVKVNSSSDLLVEDMLGALQFLETTLSIMEDDCLKKQLHRLEKDFDAYTIEIVNDSYPSLKGLPLNETFF